MDEALELARAKDTKERMAGVERLHQLLGASRKSLSSSEVAALVDCCMDLLKDNNFRVSQGALQALASATVLSGDLLKLHFNALVPAVVERLGNAKQPVRDAARRLLLTLMEADVDNSGAIDYGEFIAASVHLNKQEREELLVAAFRYIDKDFSGYITVDELQQACAEHNMADITSKRQNSNLEDPLDAELQKIADMVTSDNMEEELQFTHSAKIIEDLTIVGDGDMFDASDEFLSLTTKVYENREDLICDVRRIGLVQGFVVVIKRSRPNKGNVTLGCDRGGSYKTRVADENKKNNSSSRLINCPFEIMGRKKAEGMWKVEIVTLLHNHAQSTNMSGHPYCRRFSEEEAKQLKQMDRAGIKPRQILSSLRQNNPNLLAVSRNVYSKTAQFRKESLGGRSVIRALLDELGEAGFTHNVKHDHYGNLTHLFFAHPTSIELTKSYPNVFVMDCTYKTNKYKMPLLEIIGVSSFNKSFYSCFVFLQKEEQEDYEWAMEMFSKLLGVGDHTLTIVTDRELALMNAIEVVFPQSSNLLCIWHINKNIAAHCKGHFKDDADWVVFMSSWAALVKSWNVSLFTEAWNNLQVEYNGFPEVLSYIENTWLPWKEKFVFAWTGQISHFGNSVTSRTEGAHATLKRYLEVSRGGLREVKEKVCLAIENQFQEFKTQLENEKIRVPHKLYIPFFKETVNKVSFHALFEVHKQYVLANTKDYSTLCKGQFYKTMGLPCVHMIKEKNLEVLPLNQIHKQWRIDTRSFDNDHHASLVQEDPLTCLLSDIRQKYEKQPLVQKESTRRQLSQILSASSPLIFEPTIQPHKGRPVGATNKRKETSSTRREPSLFEIVEKTPRKCSRCGNIGHYKNKCQSINNSVDLGTQ